MTGQPEWFYINASGKNNFESMDYQTTESAISDIVIVAPTINKVNDGSYVDNCIRNNMDVVTESFAKHLNVIHNDDIKTYVGKHHDNNNIININTDSDTADSDIIRTSPKFSQFDNDIEDDINVTIGPVKIPNLIDLRFKNLQKCQQTTMSMEVSTTTDLVGEPKSQTFNTCTQSNGIDTDDEVIKLDNVVNDVEFYTKSVNEDISVQEELNALVLNSIILPTLKCVTVKYNNQLILIPATTAISSRLASLFWIYPKKYIKRDLPFLSEFNRSIANPTYIPDVTIIKDDCGNEIYKSIKYCVFSVKYKKNFVTLNNGRNSKSNVNMSSLNPKAHTNMLSVNCDANILRPEGFKRSNAGIYHYSDFAAVIIENGQVVDYAIHGVVSNISEMIRIHQPQRIYYNARRGDALDVFMNYQYNPFYEACYNKLHPIPINRTNDFFNPMAFCERQDIFCALCNCLRDIRGLLFKLPEQVTIIDKYQHQQQQQDLTYMDPTLPLTMTTDYYKQYQHYNTEYYYQQYQNQTTPQYTQQSFYPQSEYNFDYLQYYQNQSNVISMPSVVVVPQHQEANDTSDQNVNMMIAASNVNPFRVMDNKQKLENSRNTHKFDYNKRPTFRCDSGSGSNSSSNGGSSSSSSNIGRNNNNNINNKNINSSYISSNNGSHNNKSNNDINDSRHRRNNNNREYISNNKSTDRYSTHPTLNHKIDRSYRKTKLFKNTGKNHLFQPNYNSRCSRLRYALKKPGTYNGLRVNSKYSKEPGYRRQR